MEEKRNKKNMPSDVWGVHDRHQGISLMGSVTLILGCCLVLILRKGEWNELTGHPKDWMNSRTNSLQHGENDADHTEFGASLLLRSILRSSVGGHLIALVSALERTRDFMLISCILVINYDSISLF